MESNLALVDLRLATLIQIIVMLYLQGIHISCSTYNHLTITIVPYFSRKQKI